MNVYELISFILYFIAVIGIGLYFFTKVKSKSEKDYFLGGRNMGGWVSALSAGASDMSAWVLMGLPGAIFVSGLCQVWISIGLLIGTILSWLFIAPRLRRYAIKAGDAITVPQFLSNRFKTENPTLRIFCAIVFVAGYCLYSASSIYACGRLFNLIISQVSQPVAMVISAVIILTYTLLGGFNAVCWTDFFQGLLMLMALMLVPIIAFISLQSFGALSPVDTPVNYYNMLASGSFDWESIASILTGLGWGLGYFGMPHIIIRYMAIKSEKEMKKSQIIGSTWTFLILLMATLFALVAHEYLGGGIIADGNEELVFVTVVRHIFSNGALALIGGILVSAVIAASMSTADSQLLASSSAFASDVYKSVINKKATDKQMLNVGRITVFAITIVAFALAMLVYIFSLTGIMGLVSAAWSIFGAAFGPVIILALYWKKLNYEGACAGILTGFLVSVLWMVLFNLGYYGYNAVIADTGLYEIIPGFIISLVVAVAVSLYTKKPSLEIQQVFDEVNNFTE